MQTSNRRVSGETLETLIKIADSFDRQPWPDVLSALRELSNRRAFETQHVDSSLASKADSWRMVWELLKAHNPEFFEQGETGRQAVEIEIRRLQTVEQQLEESPVETSEKLLQGSFHISEDERDAARYRFLRQPGNAIVYAKDRNAWGKNASGHVRWDTPEQLDAAIDAAIGQSSSEETSCARPSAPGQEQAAAAAGAESTATGSSSSEKASALSALLCQCGVALPPPGKRCALCGTVNGFAPISNNEQVTK